MEILRLHSFRFNECAHVYSEEGSNNAREMNTLRTATMMMKRPMYTYCEFDVIDIGIQLSNR